MVLAVKEQNSPVNNQISVIVDSYLEKSSIWEAHYAMNTAYGSPIQQWFSFEGLSVLVTNIPNISL